MKKIMTFILVLSIVFCGVAAVSISASAKVSPTAPTITRPTGGEDIPTVPSSPHVTETKPTTPGDTTGPNVPGGSTEPGKPTSPSQTASPTTVTAVPTTPDGKPIYTTPDGSTVTGTAKPDDSPSAPETGDTSAEVFVFAGVAMATAAAAVLLKKNKEDEQ